MVSSQEFSRAGLKALAKEQIRGKIPILFVCALLIGLISGASSFVPVLPIILMPPFMIATHRIYLNLTASIQPEISDIFSGFNVMAHAILAYLLMGLFVFLWSLLLFIPGIIKMYSYSMTYYILAENPGMTGLEAINESRRMMDGRKLELFVLHLSFIPWTLLVGVTFGLAGVYVIPYMNATIANFYVQLKGAQS